MLAAAALEAVCSAKQGLEGGPTMRRWILGSIIVGTLIVLALFIGPQLLLRVEVPIKVGILHSKSGPLAISERSMIDAELMAIDEINSGGGLLGRRVEAVEADGRSDPRVFAQEAHRLIESEKVSVIFGCWSTMCRRSVEAVVESSNHLLVFPSNYEGMEISSSVVCTGPIPNQQIIPAVNWCFRTLKARRFFLAGSQDIQSYASNRLIRDQLKAMGAQATGEKYVALDGAGMPDLISAIKQSSPDVVLSTIIGDGNRPFYQQLAQAGLMPARLPVLSFTIGEEEVSELPIKDLVGDYAAWSYFQSVDNPVNREFVQRFKSRYGADRSTSDSVVAAHDAVKLWAQAVDEVRTDNTAEVRKAISRESLFAPEGVVSVDFETLHTWRPFYLGKVQANGQFEIVWRLEKPVRPEPFPVLRSRSEWEAYIDQLYASWGTSGFDPLAVHIQSGPLLNGFKNHRKPSQPTALLSDHQAPGSSQQ
jgi:urea transport system substrate-binding protein